MVFDNKALWECTEGISLWWKDDGFIFTGSWRISLNYLRFWTLIWFHVSCHLRCLYTSYWMYLKCVSVSGWACVFVRTTVLTMTVKWGKLFVGPQCPSEFVVISGLLVRFSPYITLGDRSWKERLSKTILGLILGYRFKENRNSLNSHSPQCL